MTKMKKIIRISRLAAVALIIAVTALLAACSGGSTVEKTPSADKAQASITVAKNELTLDEAIDAALADAGVERENAVFSKAKLDPDDTPHYEIEFSVTVDGMAEEFDYEILASDGKILKHEREVKSGVTSATETKAEPSKPSSTATGGYISVDDAKAAALAHAKLSADNVKFVKAKFDGNDIKPHYDIEFISGGSEYDYEIEAVGGKVMEYEVERAGASSAADGGDLIGSAKAEQIALDNAGLAKSEVRKLKTELDSDGTIAHYDVEFVSGGFEYEYEINAKTGAIIASEKDRD